MKFFSQAKSVLKSLVSPRAIHSVPRPFPYEATTEEYVQIL